LPAMLVVLAILFLVALAVGSELIFEGSISSFLYYYGVIPFYVYYIAGRRIATWHTAFILLVVWSLWLLSLTDIVSLQYSLEELLFFTPLLLFSAFCAWMFEVEREENKRESYDRGQQHDSLLQVLDEVYYRVDMQGIIQRIGGGITKFTDFTPEEVVNQPIAMFYAVPEEREAYVTALTTHGKVTNYPITIKGKGGQLVNISMNATIIFDDKKVPKHIEGVFRDVTKEVKHENERIVHFNHLQKLHVVEEALSSQDLETALEDVIQALLSVFGASRAYLTPLCFLTDGKDEPCYQRIFYKGIGDDIDFNPASFASEEEVKLYLASVPKHQKALNQVVQGQSIFSEALMQRFGVTSHAMIVLHTNQDTYWLLGLQNIQQGMNQPQQDLFMDISRRITATLNQLLLQRDLELTAYRAEVASKAKGEFVATISHELRTPLHGVIGLLDLMGQEATKFSQEQQQNLALAQASTQVLRSLIDDVLDLSKIESGSVEIQKQSFYLKQALVDALIPFVMKAREKGIGLNLEVRNAAEMIEGDVQRLRQVLLNLVGNAIKFTAQGYVRIVVTQDDDYLFINIEDSGIGIARDRQGEVFKPFSQVHDVEVLGSNLQEKGTGLGTTISQYFITMMGGELSLQSESCVGSTMTIRLPLHQVGQGRESIDLQMEDLISSSQITGTADLMTSQNEQSKSSKTWRVLLAEDDPIGRRVAVKRLQRAGFEVLTADDGLQAYTKLQEESFDLLLTDIRMPGLSGLELTKKIRADEMREKVKDGEQLLIIGLSAYALEDVKAEALAAGMNDFVSKPVDMNVLITLLENNFTSHD